MGNSPAGWDRSSVQSKIQTLLGKEITLFSLKGKGFCNNAYYVETREGGKFIVKEQRTDTGAGTQENSLSVEATLLRQLYALGLSIPIPRVVFISENPNMLSYEYIEGEMMKDMWEPFSEEEKIATCETLGHFHAEIGGRVSRERALLSGIKNNESLDVHPENLKEYGEILASSDVPEKFKTIAKEARALFEGTMDVGVFHFIHNDSHHENILIMNKHISGIIDFGSAEYGEVAKEFSRYIRDYPDYFEYIVSAYEKESGNTLSRTRLVSFALLSGLIDIVENYRKGGEDRIQAEKMIETYQELIHATNR